MNEKLSQLIKQSTENGEVDQEKLTDLIVLHCCEILSEKALSFYDPSNPTHAKKEAWDRSLSWAIRDASEEIKTQFGID